MKELTLKVNQQYKNDGWLQSKTTTYNVMRHLESNLPKLTKQKLKIAMLHDTPDGNIRLEVWYSKSASVFLYWLDDMRAFGLQREQETPILCESTKTMVLTLQDLINDSLDLIGGEE